MVKRLFCEGHGVTALDDFSTSYRNSLVGGMLIESSLADVALPDRGVFRRPF